ncbi:MAG: zinc ABC transporter substrate-binding protein [Acidimicrobiia bacterium]|jgi:zinc/manganese transport system substrate-binding protein|nr:zinc ABC transporter substrate-binding protein [Acidimicrobiia bacterium]
MRAVPIPVRVTGVVLVMASGLAACGDDGDTSAGSAADRPQVVVTTSILGDIVRAVVGEQADVEVILPLGADPHDFEPSAREAEAMAEADLLVVNGAGFEEGMLDIIDAAEDAGAPVLAFADHVELREATQEDVHEDEGEHADEEGDEHAEDPHIWTDPAGMVGAVEAFTERAAELDGVDAELIGEQGAAYAAELQALDAEVEELLAGVSDDRRVLVTNHEVFGYFADRYDFEVIGTVIPSMTTNADASAAEVEALAELIDAEGVPAIFGESSSSAQLAEALADSAGGDVEVVELFTESLGEDGSGAETYVGLIRTDAELIAEGLA